MKAGETVKMEVMRKVTYDLLPKDIKEIRSEILSMSQDQFAEALGLSLDFVRSLESGRVLPSYKTMIAISELADIDFVISAKKKHPFLLKKLGAV